MVADAPAVLCVTGASVRVGLKRFLEATTP